MIIVEDILDSGMTLISQQLSKGQNQVNKDSYSLDKPSRRRANINADYVDLKFPMPLS